MATANKDDDDDDFAFELEDDTEVEVEDDTPPEDRGREPMPKNLVEELEADELEDYSDKVKTRLKQMKKVWHDERREKERESREKMEAVSISKRLMEENRRLKDTLSTGENHLVDSYKNSTQLELDTARKAYKEAYEEGDSDKVLDAAQKMNAAQIRMENLKSYRPALQAETEGVPITEAVSVPRPDPKTVAWQERNGWWGSDEEMTASALGLHQKLSKQHGDQFIGTDEYWNSIDTTMRRRFPEYFGDDDKPAKSASRPANVVAPASRSTSSKKITLTASQVSIARKLGVTNEQYAKEFAKEQRKTA